MNRTRWLQFGVVLVVAFLVSVAAGAWIGRQRAPASPVGAVPTQTPSVSTVFTPSPAPPAPTPTPSPAAPTAGPTAPPPATTQSPPPGLDPPSAEDFAGALLAAFQSGDTRYLFDRLHPLVFDRYGERQCRRHVNGFAPDPGANWTTLSSSGPAPWEWETDGLTTTVNDAWTVTIEIPESGEREVHFAPFEGSWRWFLDCGDPR